ncbi:MAG: isochorismate synthase, partial [Actinomycetes bacterium]
MSGTGAQPLAVGGLRAVTRRIDLGDDLLDALGPDGFCWIEHGMGVATAGVAATVAADDAVATLAAIPHDTEVAAPGSGPVAVGALPFD